MAQTDAEERFFLRFFLQQRHKPCGGELFHGVCKSADAWQNDAIGGSDLPGVAAHDVVEIQIAQRVAHAEEISGTVINDCDHANTPFVESTPPSRGASAAASACATALKMPSTMWWAFLP